MPLIALLAIVGAALLLLAAHLLHGGFLPLAGLALCSIALLAVPRRWAARTLQALLGIATIEWALTTYVLAQMRATHGQPYLRLVLILGAVTFFTAFAVLVFELPPMRRRFGPAHPRTIDS
jgi:hypothetical protein